MTLTIAVLYARALSTGARERQLGDRLKQVAEALAAIVLVLGHPVASLGALALCMLSGLYTQTSFNEAQVNPIAFFALVWGIGWARWMLFRRQTRAAQPRDCLREFVRANRPAIPGLALTLAFTRAIEGNVFGILYMPFIILTILLIVPSIKRRSREGIKRLSSH
ncbi:hypothetical protein A6A05_03385 [Magnetospirillum moscoviense]|uniref:Uncharacterized protein n=1 Tax=Magnetospirillum moscoviense TaxID=1437059 RepID=A0A178MGS8_9PROT|nr:hypothetical protein A6A05_03385 [Magnetospirillum moscoviense]